MGLTLPTLPTPNVTNGNWGDEIVDSINAINDADQYKVKTADQTVSASTVLVDDTHLAALTLGVGTWVIEAVYFCSGTAAGDIKLTWNHSGTFTGYRGGIGPSSGVTSVLTGAGAGTRTAGASDTTAVITGSASYAVDGTNFTTIVERGILIVTVSGTFKIQWAQLVASGSTILRAGSHIHARKVAS